MSYDLTKYKFLAFDIYATLIDWETGIYEELLPLISRLPASSPVHAHTPLENKNFLLYRFTTHELAIQTAEPALLYSFVLARIYTLLATDLDVSIGPDEPAAFAASIGEWVAYPDTVAAMQTLGKYYKLAPLSNVDRVSFGRTLSGPLAGVKFDAIYVAQDIGSYKPNLRNFNYLIEHVKEEFGIEKEEIIMVAQSLSHDHVPAKKLGMSPGVWISRGGDEGGMGHGNWEKLKDQVDVGAIYETLGDMAAAVEKAFANANSAVLRNC